MLSLTAAAAAAQIVSELPSKLPGTRWSSSWISRRRGVHAIDPATITQLNAYLKHILADETLCKSEHLFHFFCGNSVGEGGSGAPFLPPPF